MDGAVVEARGAEPLHTGRTDRGRCGREFVRVRAQRAVSRPQPRRAPVTREPFDEAIRGVAVRDSKIRDLGPEVVRVRVDSIVAPVGTRNHHCQHLPLTA